MERADRSAAERSSGRRPVRRSKCTRSGTRHPRRRRSRATILSPPPLWADRPSRCLPREAVHILKQGAAVAISPLHRRLSTTEAGEGRLCDAVRWTAAILEEVERSLVAKRTDGGRIRRRFKMLREHFPDWEIEGYAALVPVMTCDETDRHVLAAVCAGADQIVSATFRRHRSNRSGSRSGARVRTLPARRCRR